MKIDKPGGLPVKCAALFAPAFWWVEAEVVKLVDTPASGAGWGNPVEVQVLSSAPFIQIPSDTQSGTLLIDV
jgi:hypothetical protein